MKYRKPSEMFDEFYTDPDGDKLTSNRYQLEKKPGLTQFHFGNHAPGIVQWYQRFPGRYTCFPEHTIQAHMP